MGRPLLDFESVESGRDNSQQSQIFQCSSRLSRSSPSFLFSRIISQGSARNSIFSQRSYPDSGRTREGNSIGVLFYKYLSSFESPSGTEDLFTSCHCLPSSHSVFFAPSPFPRPKSPSPIPVYLFLQIFYTFRTRICIYNGRKRPELALPSRFRTLFPSYLILSLCSSPLVLLFA